jgi:hypothetical protein
MLVVLAMVEPTPWSPNIVRELALISVVTMALLKALTNLLATILVLLLLKMLLMRLLLLSLESLAEGIHLLCPSSPTSPTALVTPTPWLLKPNILPLALTVGPE